MRTMMKRYFFSVLLGTLALAAAAEAVPTLQVGAPGPPGTYADYQVNLTDPTESDTAVTSGNTIYVAGVYGPTTLKLGGQYLGSPANGESWTDKSLSIFGAHGAVLIVTVPEGASLTGLTVDLNSPFATATTGIDSIFPNSHDPVKDTIGDFMFFDIGDFAKNTGAVPDFSTETGSADGQIKTLALSITGSYGWIHFDVMALETNKQGQTEVRTSVAFNPGSKDVTWKEDGGGGGGGNVIPEPGTFLLLGGGLVGLALLGTKKLGR